VSITLPSGVSLSFDPAVPGLSLSVLSDCLSMTNDGRRAHVHWQRVPRRALLVHLYDTLSLHSALEVVPPRADALAAWDDLHPQPPATAVVARDDGALVPSTVGQFGGRPMELAADRGLFLCRKPWTRRIRGPAYRTERRDVPEPRLGDLHRAPLSTGGI
jgi:hypothetical protein